MISAFVTNNLIIVRTHSAGGPEDEEYHMRAASVVADLFVQIRRQSQNTFDNIIDEHDHLLQEALLSKKRLIKTMRNEQHQNWETAANRELVCESGDDVRVLLYESMLLYTCV